MNLKRKAFVTGLLFILPSLLVYTTFHYIAYVQSLYYAFMKWNAIEPPTFIGLDNFNNFFTDPVMISGLGNTLKMVVFGILIQNPIALVVASQLNKKFRSGTYLRISFYLPIIISLVVASVVWGQLLQYDGFINGVLSAVGMDHLIRDWLGTVQTSFPTIIALTQWQAIGFCAIIYLAGLQAIPKDIYEAAEIEGAKGLKMFIYVTFPMLMPAVTIVLFLTISGALRLFDLPYLLTDGGPGTSSYTLFLAIYKAAFTNLNYGYATAAGLVLGILIVIVSLLQLSITRRREVEM
jgi:raffinose/stachyose/melibiose transport system permease protein